MKRRSICTLLLALLSFGAPAWAAKVTICHVPPGNPSNFHTITISDNALPAHLGHGDLVGACSANCGQLCDDGNACTIDACDAGGHCAATHPPVNCNDSNACTTDSCNPATGCASAPKTCVDGNLCTVDSCDPITGNCVFPPVACPIDQTCNPANGNCESTAVDNCLSDPCFRGTCVSQPNGFTCQCPPGYTGDSCDIDIDECESNPCLNGDCTDQVNSYQCSCLPGFTGPNCEIEASPTYNCTDRNPCTPENILAGSFYFAADDPGRFIQCAPNGACFIMQCGPGESWDPSSTACNP